MDSARRSLVIAALFRAEGIDIAVEQVAAPHCFSVPNTEEGLSTFERELVALRLREPPFLCLCMSPVGHLQGVFFEELHAAPFPKFIMAQHPFLAYADRANASPESAATLLAAFREQFPKESHAA